MVKNRSLIPFVIALVVVIAVCFTVPAMKAEPKGLFLPGLTYHPYPPQKNKGVSWLLYPPAWGSYPQLGHLSFEFHDPSASPEKRKQIMQAMMAAAAKAGGNAVVKQQLFSTAGYVGSQQALWVGKGVVILAPAK